LGRKMKDSLNFQEMGERLKAIRKALNKTQRDMSLIGGFPLSAISEMESADIRPQPLYLFLLASDFHVNLNWVFTGTGAMFNPDFEIKWDFGQDTQRVFDIVYLLEKSPEIRYMIMIHFMDILRSKKTVVDSYLQSRKKK